MKERIVNVALSVCVSVALAFGAVWVMAHVASPAFGAVVASVNHLLAGGK